LQIFCLKTFNFAPFDFNTDSLFFEAHINHTFISRKAETIAVIIRAICWIIIDRSKMSVNESEKAWGGKGAQCIFGLRGFAEVEISVSYVR
jgi:hypothetical protein